MAHFVKNHEKLSIWQRLAFLWSKLSRFDVSMNFSEKSCKMWLVSWKSTKNHGFGQNLQLFEQTTMLLRLDERFSKQLQKLRHFVKKHEKSSIWPNYATSSNKLPCFGVSMNLSAKGCKKWFNSCKSTKNHRSGQNFATFRTNKLPCLCISMNFSGKSCKKCLIS